MPEYKKAAKSKYWLWALLGLPCVCTLLRYSTDTIAYGKVIHETGQWSVGLLLAAMSVSTLQKLFPRSGWTGYLRYHRRAVGVASFGYAAVHTLVYLEYKWGAGLILRESLHVALSTGWIALLLMALLAATSNRASVKALRENWRRLHRIVYAVAAFTFIHWVLTSFDPAAAYLVLALLCVIESLRLVPKKV